MRSSDSFYITRRVCGWLVCLVCLSNGLPVTNDLYTAESQHARRVLIVSTGSRFAPGFPVAEQATVERLRQLNPGDLEFHAESLDIVRFPSESYQRLFRDYLRDKYAHDLPDLIILVYVGNLGIAEKLLGELFPKAPVVVVGLTELGIQNKVSV